MSAHPGSPEAEFGADHHVPEAAAGARTPLRAERSATEGRPRQNGEDAGYGDADSTAVSGGPAPHWAVVALAVVACILMAVLNVFRRVEYTGDEGFYGVTALNMLVSPDYVLRPAYFPLGDFSANKDGFAHPPFNSYAYAASLWVAGGSRIGPEVLSVLNFAALLFLAFHVLAPFDRRAAWLAVGLIAAAPAISGYYGMLEAEPLMTTFGLGSVACCIWADFRRGRGWLFLGGLALGMSFALKLWLFGPLALAAAAALVLRMVRAPATPVAYALGAGLFGLGLVIPAGAHLVAIAVVHPADVSFWLRNIYFGVFTHAGISGAKVAGDATPAAWVHPVWYYGAALYRDHFFLAPAFLFGAPAIWAELRDRVARPARAASLAVLSAGFLGVVPLSLLKVKEPLYVLSCSVFLYLLAAVCLSALARRWARGARQDALTLWSGTAAIVALIAGVVLARLRGIQPENVTAIFVVAHTAALGAALGVILWMWAGCPHPAARTRGERDRVDDTTVRGRRAAATERGEGTPPTHEVHREAKFADLGKDSIGGCLERALVSLCAVAVLVGFSWSWVTRVPRAATIVDVVAPAVGVNPPQALTFIASNFKCFQYLTFRRGMYWHELPEGVPLSEIMRQREYRDMRAFVLGPEDLRRPDATAWLAWLG